MRTRTINVNGKDYVFICRSAKNRSGFTHDCEMQIGGQSFTHHTQYYNRTWERYTFQSVMKGALYNYKEHIVKCIKENFLEENGYNRMSPSRKIEFEKILAENPQLKEIAEVKKDLDENSTWW
jgi:hypothetical protein